MNYYDETIKKELQIAKAIHYPNCWDTSAYPSLVSALWEMCDFDGTEICSTCKKIQEQGKKNSTAN